jgi:hypothetical protein
MNIAVDQDVNEQTALVVAEARTTQAFTRGQLGKAKRAFAKAGQLDASEEVHKKWLGEMSAADVAVMKFRSSRLAKVIKGELAVSELGK